MRALKLISALVAIGLVLGAVASRSWGQATRERAPTIRIYSVPGVNATGFVLTHVRLSENAYVFVVETDLDGQIQVLHPDFPGISVKISARRPAPLPNFFGGFGQSRMGGPRYLGSRGAAIALASSAPFNLDLISSGGDWNISAIRRLIDGRLPEAGMDALASYLGAKGEPIGRDFMWFGGR